MAKKKAKGAEPEVRVSGESAKWLSSFRRPLDRLNIRLQEARSLPSDIWENFAIADMQPERIGPATGSTYHELGWVLSNKICNAMFAVVAQTIKPSDRMRKAYATERAAVAVEPISSDAFRAILNETAKQLTEFDRDQFLAMLRREHTLARQCAKASGGKQANTIKRLGAAHESVREAVKFASFVQGLIEDATAQEPPTDSAAEKPTPPKTTAGAKPRRDKAKKTLTFGGETVKTFRQVATNQFLVLDSFEEYGWMEKIDDPLPPATGIKPRARVNDTVRRRWLRRVVRLNAGRCPS